MSEFYSIVTNLGRAKIATAMAGESPLGLKSIAVGDGNGNPVDPDPSQSSLVRETYRADLTDLKVDPLNPNYMIAEMIIPTAVGGWTVREVGLFDEDNNLIAVCNYPQSYKPVVSEGSGRDMQIRMIVKVEDGESESLELKIDPAVVLASREWVTLNFSLAATIPGGNTGQILRKASNADGDTEWYDPLSGLNVLVETVEESQALAAAQDVIVLAIATTASTAYFIDGVRLHPDEYTIDSDTQLTLAVAATGGEKFLAVQNEPAAGLDFLRKAENLADIPNKSVARNNLGVPTLSETISAVLDALYPVGEVLMTNRAAAPNTWGGAWNGFGTWERFAKGRTLVGYDESDSDFNVIGKQGGAKKHQLTVNELPSHVHRYAHAYFVNGAAEEYPSLFNFGAYTYGGGTPDDAAQESNTKTTGDNEPHNNLQPYRVIYYWRRTA